MRNVLVSIAVVTLAALLDGCVSSDSRMLDATTAVISERSHTELVSTADLTQKTLVDAATLAKSQGFQYFAIVSSADASRSGTVVFPGQTYGTASVIGSSVFANSYTTAGVTANYILPGQDVTVQFYHEGEVPAGTPNVWSVASVLAAQPK